MQYIADLHVHSHYAYATSRDLNLSTLYQWAQIKGIDLVGTGDFTHPAWLHTLQEQLIEEGTGFFRLREQPAQPAWAELQPSSRPVHFCLSTEVSCVYTHAGKLRKSHHLLYAPDFETVGALNEKLARYGDLQADGRPTLALSAADLLALVVQTSPQAHLIPAHVWTPWFGILGSRTGYDSVEACFQEMTPHIFALETGLSADPAMGWQVEALHRYTFVSNSDAHSPANLGREASLFDTACTYPALFAALKTGQGFLGTLEFFPQEGKYYLDGHRNCDIAFYPEQTKAHAGLCPACGRRLTLGVLNRVQTLGGPHPSPMPPPRAANFSHIIPLPEILSELLGKGRHTKTVRQAYTHIINTFGTELAFLREVSLPQIERQLGPLYASAIGRLRQGEVETNPGYDGRYGVISLLKQQPPTLLTLWDQT